MQICAQHFRTVQAEGAAVEENLKHVESDLPCQIRTFSALNSQEIAMLDFLQTV